MDVEKSSIIYTIGRMDIYEPLFDTPPIPRKAKGGSVWKTFDDARLYSIDGYLVYGVIADWDLDTKIEVDCEYRSLTRGADLIKLPR